MDLYNRNKYLKLLVCIIADIIGMANYFIPGLGEFIDVVWAPIASALNFALFRGKIGAVGALFTFIEEILPGVTDWLPSLTITWFAKYVIFSKQTHKEFALQKKK